MVIDVLGEPFDALLYGSIHGLFHVGERQDRRTIYSGKRLMSLRGLLEEVHDLLELILGALGGRTQPAIEELEEDVILIGHVIRTSAAILDGRGEANIGRGLREDRGVELVISEVTEDGFGGGNVGIIYFAVGRCIYGSLQVEFLPHISGLRGLCCIPREVYKIFKSRVT